MKALLIDDERLARQELLFLDVQMPGRSGFDLLEALEETPQVIFTTAYEQFALRAFEVSALDYLVKPVVPARLAAALAKLNAPAETALDADRQVLCAMANGAGS